MRVFYSLKRAVFLHSWPQLCHASSLHKLIGHQASIFTNSLSVHICDSFEDSSLGVRQVFCFFMKTCRCTCMALCGFLNGCMALLRILVWVYGSFVYSKLGARQVFSQISCRCTLHSANLRSVTEEMALLRSV